MKTRFVAFNFLALLLLISCSQQEILGLECKQLRNSEEAQSAMRAISMQQLESSNSIKENLLGDWGLIGIVPGWRKFKSGEKCLHLTITEDAILLLDMKTGIESTISYEVIPFEINSYTGFYLRTDEDVWNKQVGIEVFSENKMFGSGKIADGDIYIYEKL